MRIPLKYVGKHQAKGVVEVNESIADDLVRRGDFTKLDQQVKQIAGTPSSSWTEAKIKKWIEAKGLPVSYDVKRETKADKLEELKEKGYI